MAITFDKKHFKNIEKAYKKGKQKYAIKTALLGALFFAVFMTIFNFFALMKDQTTLRIFLFFIFYLVFFFVTNYFLNLYNWKNIEKSYFENKEYWESTDPDFLK